jgi:putrescine transport system substrate-binding protein
MRKREVRMSVLDRRAALKAGGAALATPFLVRTARAEETVHVYNWADYIGETTLDDFQKLTGIKVVYDTYDSTESAEAKLLAGKTGYDVVLQSGQNLPRFIQAGVYQKLDKSKLPNWKNLDPEILKIVSGWDPGNAFGVPYMWGDRRDHLQPRHGQGAPRRQGAPLLARHPDET